MGRTTTIVKNVVTFMEDGDEGTVSTLKLDSKEDIDRIRRRHCNSVVTDIEEAEPIEARLLSRPAKEAIIHKEEETKAAPSSAKDVDRLEEISDDTSIEHHNQSTMLTDAPKFEYEEGLPRLLMEGLQSDDSHVVFRALDSVLEMFETKSEAKDLQRLEKLGGNGHLVLAMQKWRHNKRVLARACVCIATVVHKMRDLMDEGDPSIYAMDTIHAFVALGAMDLILYAMKRYHDSATVQQEALLALTNLIVGSDLSESLFIEEVAFVDGWKNGAKPSAATDHLVNKYILGEANGLSLVVQALKRFTSDDEVQQVGLFLLKFLATKGGVHRDVLRKAKVMDVLEQLRVQGFKDVENEKVILSLVNSLCLLLW